MRLTISVHCFSSHHVSQRDGDLSIIELNHVIQHKKPHKLMRNWGSQSVNTQVMDFLEV